MKTFIAIFLNDAITFTGKQFKNRLDVYNYICRERLALKYGKLIVICEK